MQEEVEKAVKAPTLQKLATKDNDLKKKPSLVKNYEPFENVSVTSTTSRRKQEVSSLMRKVKKKMHLKVKESESEKIRRRSMVEKITKDSFHNQLKNWVCLLCNQIISRVTHNIKLLILNGLHRPIR